MPTDILMYLLLVLALAIGFGLGYLRRRPAPTAAVDPKFYQSLNYLLNDEQDLAVDALIEQLGIDDGTYDTYLALGTLVRRRGEVDKAINIHQNLLARPDLPAAKRAEAELELASDFLGAGLLGRAENLLLTMLENVGSERGEGVKQTKQHAQALLVGLYERESDWDKALTVARALAKADESYRPLAAHLCCEMAEAGLADALGSNSAVDSSDPTQSIPLSKSALTAVREHVKEGRKFAPDSARVALVAGKIDLHAGAVGSALKQFEQALSQDPDLAIDLLPLASAACKAEQNPKRLLKFVRRGIEQLDDDNRALPSSLNAPVGLLLAEAQLLQQLEDDEAAQRLLLEYLGSINSVSQLSGLLANIHTDVLAAAIPAGLLETLVQHLQQVVAAQHEYRCRNCGFGASSRHWRCPSCQQWGSHRAVA